MGLSLNWHDGGGEGAGADARRHRGVAGRGGRAGPARPRLPHGDRGLGPGHRAAARASAARVAAGAGVPRFGGFMQWSLPFGAVSAANWLAMVAQRRMHEFGLTREQLGAIAINNRANAALNPKAIYRDPMSMDDYLAARMITTPLCLFDCDAPCDGVDRGDRVAPRRRRRPGPPGRADQRASAPRCAGRPSWDQFDDMTTMAARDAAASMWERTELKPGRRRHRAALRRLLDPHHHLARGARVLRAGRERALHRGRRQHRPRRAAAAEHGGRPALGRAPARLRADPRGLRPAARRGRRASGRAAGRPGGRGGRGGERWRADRRVDVADARGALSPWTGGRSYSSPFLCARNFSISSY